MTTDPLPNTPSHTVLMHVAFGDHQVSDTTAEVEARTIGARAYQPALVAGRSPWPRLQMIPSIGSFPFGGSAIVFWDTGPRPDGGHGDRGDERAAGRRTRRTAAGTIRTRTRAPRRARASRSPSS